jgi:hypothetical protein
MNVKTITAVPRSAIAGGALGALIGGSIAAAQNSYHVARGDIKCVEGIKNIFKESVGSGLSGSAGAAIVTGLGLSGFMGFTGFLVVSSAAKGLWDSVAYEPIPKKT